MKHLKLIFLCVSICTHLSAGISEDTIILTADGLKKVQDLCIQDCVISADNDFSPKNSTVETIEKIELPGYIEIVLEDDNILEVSPEQRLFTLSEWLEADRLSVGDQLLSENQQLYRIKDISYKQQPKIFYFITLNAYHNFYATENAILMHNGAAVAMVGYWVVKGLGYGIPAIVGMKLAAIAAPVVVGTGIKSGLVAGGKMALDTGIALATEGAIGGGAAIGGSSLIAGEVVVSTVGVELAKDAVIVAHAASAGSCVGGYIGFVESAASAAATLGMWLTPW